MKKTNLKSPLPHFLATVLPVLLSPPVVFVVSLPLLPVRVAGGVATVVAGVSKGVSQAVRYKIVKVTCAIVSCVSREGLGEGGARLNDISVPLAVGMGNGQHLA